jgi:hypothetical protein
MRVVTIYGFFRLTEAQAFEAGVEMVNDAAIEASAPFALTEEEAEEAVAGIPGDLRTFCWGVKVVDLDGRPTDE